MRILQVCPGSYVSGRGGISEHVLHVSEALVKLGHDVTVFATNSGELPNFEVKNKVKVRRFSRIAPGGAYFFSPTMIFSLINANFDVVHAHNFQSFPLHFAPLARCKKFIVTTHFHGAGHSILRDCLFKILRFFGKITLLKTDIIIAVSKFERSLLINQFGLNENSVVVIPNGVDFEEFKGLSKRKSDFRRILFVGRLESYKGVQYLIEILPRLGDQVVLEVVGRGGLRTKLEDKAKKLSVSKRIFFFENLSRKELLQKYLDSDVFILLSSREAYGIVVAEALVSGTPCIVANTSALSEWIDDVHCFGIDFPFKLDVLAKLIEKCIKIEVKKLSLLERKKILSWMDVVHKLEEYYKE